jgi:soluble cytochrome b562
VIGRERTSRRTDQEVRSPPFRILSRRAASRPVASNCTNPVALRAPISWISARQNTSNTNLKDMKLRLLTLTLISALVALPVLCAQEGGPKKMGPKEDQTELGDKMEKLNGAYRKLGKQISDATKNEDSLAQVAIIKESAEAALKLEPAKKKDLPEAEQAKFVADYQGKMKEFIAMVGKLETALKAGDNAAAAKLVDDMKLERNADHKQFQKKKEKKS